jgi:hypothetical protein
LFVEPLDTVDLNNELVRLTEEELREVHRILRELSERLRAYSPAIARTLEVMGELELLFIKRPEAATSQRSSPSTASACSPRSEEADYPRLTGPRLVADYSADQRSEHRWQDGHHEDGWPAGFDGSIRLTGAGC